VEVLHGRAGRVALLRTKLVQATPAALLEAPARKAERTAVLVRKSVEDISENLISTILDAAWIITPRLSIRFGGWRLRQFYLCIRASPINVILASPVRV
jgi:hypothetical protein